MIEEWWRSQGDPTVLGWFTVFAYALATFLCVRVAVKVPRGLAPIDQDNHRLVWFILGAIMLLLGINKQLDLQLLLWLAGRSWIRSAGWQEQRQVIQIGSMLVMAGFGFVGLLYFTWLSRDSFRHRRLAIAGVGLTSLFVLMRAVSLHGVDTMLGWSLAGLTLSKVLENAGIFLVIIGAIQSMRSPQERVTS